MRTLYLSKNMVGPYIASRGKFEVRPAAGLQDLAT